MKPCADCQRIIDAPTAPENAEPHAALRPLDGGRNIITTHGSAQNYLCEICGTRFECLDKNYALPPQDAVEWTQIP